MLASPGLVTNLYSVRMHHESRDVNFSPHVKEELSVLRPQARHKLGLVAQQQNRVHDIDNLLDMVDIQSGALSGRRVEPQRQQRAEHV